MRSWRSKFLMTLIIYFGGFATAIYYLAPASDREEGGRVTASSFDWQGSAKDVKSSEFARVAGASMKKFVGFAEEQAVKASELIKEKLAEQRRNSSK